MDRVMKAQDNTGGIIRGFDPVSGPDATRLVLGTIPGIRSLEAGRYYAHPRNAFWIIIDALLSDRPVPDYRIRKKLLIGSGIALWDVLKSAGRRGSLDSAIVPETIVVNDFVRFFVEHPLITQVFFNGRNAESLFRRHVLPVLFLDRRLRYVCLPSTSPANARLTIREKVSAWMPLVEGITGDRAVDR
jgi:double-stranded uracil-DNA glycosylase